MRYTLENYFTMFINNLTKTVRSFMKITTMLLCPLLLIGVVEASLTVRTLDVILRSVALLLVIKINSEVG